MNRRHISALVIMLLPVLFPPVAAAATSTNGLGITPVNQQSSVNAGASSAGAFTVSNQTAHQMTVTLSVKEFTVADYTYDYSFRPPKDDWIKLSDNPVSLAPHTSQKIVYDIEVPAKAVPGGYYFALVASTQTDVGSISGTVQATNLLYLTVNGKLVRTGVMRDSSIPWFATGTFIPYKFDVEDTGNVYFTAKFFGRLDSIFGPLPEKSSEHLLIPGAHRAITDSIPAPLWPGIYKATYGYKVDFADIVVAQSAYILYMPPWSFAAVVLIVLVAVWGWQSHRRSKDSPTR